MTHMLMRSKALWMEASLGTATFRLAWNVPSGPIAYGDVHPAKELRRYACVRKDLVNPKVLYACESAGLTVGRGHISVLLAAVRRRDEPDGSGCYERLGQTQGGAPKQGKTIKADRVPAGGAVLKRNGQRANRQKRLAHGETQGNGAISGA